MGYIFEEEIASILNVVRTRTIGEGEEILLKDILAAPIHPSIKAYFRAEIEKIFLQERAKEIRSKKFSYGIPEIVSLQKQIDRLLVLHYHFTRPEFETLLDESVHFQFNYLCRPQWTLLHFIFGEKRRASASTIEQKLTYCVDYSYYSYLIRRYISYHGYTELQYEDFRTLLKKIDEEVTAQHTPTELAFMLRPLFAFLEATLPPQTTERTIPINAAIVFFEDKHLNDIRERLEVERDIKGISHITIPQLIDILHSLRSPDAVANTFYAPEFKDIPLSDVTENLLQSEEQISEQTEKEGHENLQTSFSPEDTKQTHEEETAVVSEKQYPGTTLVTTVPKLLSSFSRREQEKIIKKLFHKNESEFQATLLQLEQLSSWEDVAHFLDVFFISRNIDPFSEFAILFTDKVYDYYHTRTPLP